MTLDYRLVNNPITGTINPNIILRLNDNAYIPVDPKNTDYQAYLAWIALGNVPQQPSS